jgi:hypothetical protein
MNLRSPRVVAILASALVAASAQAYPGAPTGPVSEESKTEGKTRFKKALALYEEGDTLGALAEFRRAFELTGSLVVLYNMGLLFDAKDQYVDADNALAEVLAAKPDPLKPEWRKRALEVQSHARARIGVIEVKPTLKDPPVGSDDPLKGALVELDGINVGSWPLAAPLRANIGKHNVGVLLPGFAPARSEVLVAGEATATVALELVPMAGKLAQLKIVSNVQRAQIIVDEVLVGETPLVASFAIAPGKHVIELKRKGYVTGSTVLTLTNGAIGEAKVDLREDPTEVKALGARVKVVPTEADTKVTIDGVASRANEPIALAPGPHRLRVELEGYHPIERDIEASEGNTAIVKVPLAPTPDTLASHDASISSHRTWGYVGLGAGGAVLAGGGLWLLTLLGKKTDIENRVVAFNATYLEGCPTKYPGPALNQCLAEQASIDSDQSKNRTLRNVAVGVMGLGIVGIGAGLYSLITSPDSHRYDAVRSDAMLRPRWSVVATPSFAGISLQGAF